MAPGTMPSHLRETLELFDVAGEPRGTNEVADRLAVGRRSTYDRLQRLVEEGHLETKTVGASARVWWRPPRQVDPTVPETAGTASDSIDDGTTAEDVSNPSVSERPVDRDDDLERYATIVETFPDGVFALDDEERFVVVNDAYAEMTGYDRETLLGSPGSLVRTKSIDEITTDRDGTDVRTLEFDLQTADGETIPVEARLGHYEYGENGHARTGVVRDVSERKQLEETLTALYDSARAFPAASTKRDVGRVIVETVTGVLDITGVVVYCYEETEGALVPIAHSAGPTFIQEELRSWEPGDSSVHGHVFSIGEPRRYDDVTAVSHLHHRETGMRAGVFVPLGDHGVVSIGSDTVGDFDDRTLQLLELVGTNAEAALDRVEREQALERQRKRLAALDQLNSIVREVTDAIIEQSSRAEIERIVCERLAESDSYSFAWYAEVDPKSESIEPKVEVGVEGYLDEVDLSVSPEEPIGQGPLGRAIQTRETQVSRNVFEDPSFEPWRGVPEQYGYRAAAAIPVTHEEILHGVIGVYTDREAAFSDDEREVIGQLGEIVGHAVAAVERRHALISDEIIELEFQIQHLVDALDVDGAVEGRVDLVNSVRIDDEDFLQYGSATGDGIRIVEALVDSDSFAQWESLAVIESNERTTRFEIRLSDPPVLWTVAAHGGYIDEARIEDGDFYIRVHLASRAHIRQVVDAVGDAYPSMRLVIQRHRRRDRESSSRIRGLIRNQLTERQRAALTSAYSSGYFEWPRSSTGEDVAASLEVSPATFHQHLRRAEKRVLEAALDG